MTTDELRQAHQRIAELEAMLRAAPVPPKRMPWFLYALGVLVIAGSFVAAVGPAPQTVRVETVNWVPSPEVVPEGALVLANDGAPVLATIGERPLAFVLGFRRGPNDACVVAYDRSTWKEVWRSRPLRSEGFTRGHLTVTNGFVAYASKDVVVLDARTGAWKREQPLATAATRIHVDLLDPDWVIVGHGPTGSDSHAEAFEVTTGQMREEAHDRQPPCPADRTQTCSESVPRPPADVQKLFSKDSYTYLLRDGTDAFFMVSERAAGGPGVIEHAVVAHGDKVVWHAPLAPHRKWTPWPNTAPEGKLAFAHQRILYSYIMPDGQQRLTSRDYPTGKELYDVDIDGVGYGSHVGAFTAEGNEAFLVANQSLFIFDAATGQIKKRITAF